MLDRRTYTEETGRETQLTREGRGREWRDEGK